uniref:Uncharacterized protein n=1 Tax=Wuchereria bancrofti TaxID=6293 RepID=A0AAF5PSP7_WUCBA
MGGEKKFDRKKILVVYDKDRTTVQQRTPCRHCSKIAHNPISWRFSGQFYHFNLKQQKENETTKSYVIKLPSKSNDKKEKQVEEGCINDSPPPYEEVFCERTRREVYHFSRNVLFSRLQRIIHRLNNATNFIRKSMNIIGVKMKKEEENAGEVHCKQ